MNFSVSWGGVGLLGGFVLFGALMIGFILVMTVITRAVRGRDDTPAQPGDERDRRAPEDDHIL